MTVRMLTLPVPAGFQGKAHTKRRFKRGSRRTALGFGSRAEGQTCWSASPPVAIEKKAPSFLVDLLGPVERLESGYPRLFG